MDNGVLEPFNPWWKDSKWYLYDFDYSRVRESPYVHRWYPILDKAVKQLFDGKGNYDVLILAGPRRLGKTSLMKKLIENNQNKKRGDFIYLVLDDFEIKKIVKEKGLKHLIMKYINKLKQPVVIIIDEASAIEDWDFHVKNVFDHFTRMGIKFLLIITGSLGIRLIKRASNILGRRGDIPQLSSISNPGIILPYKFSEYAESIRSINKYIRTYGLLQRDIRYKI